jgi:hypothetical protein
MDYTRVFFINADFRIKNDQFGHLPALRWCKCKTNAFFLSIKRLISEATVATTRIFEKNKLSRVGANIHPYAFILKI